MAKKHMEKKITEPQASPTRDWPKPKRDGLPVNDSKRGFANAVRFNAARRAMPFKATGHKGGISFR